MQSIQAEFQRFLSVISRKERPYCPRTMKFFEIDAPFTSFSNVRDHTNADYSLKIYRSESFLHRRTAHLKSCLPIASAAIKRAKTTFWLRGLDKIPCRITLVLLLGLGTILRLLERFDPNMLSLLYALAITDVLVMIGTFALTLYLRHSVLPSCVINAAAVAILLGGTTPPSHRPQQAF